MRTEAAIFGGVAAFFLVTGVGYGVWSGPEPAGTAALTIAFLMASVISFFFTVTYRRDGRRPEDERAGEIADRAGPVDFFPARSAYPPVTALGAAISVLGVVYAFWLFLVGFGVLAAGVGGLVFQYVRRGDAG